MTFTVLASCKHTGQVGIGIATASIAVGGLCPFYTDAGDIITSQAFARPEIGLAVMRHLQERLPLSEIGALLAQADEHLGYRQIAVLTRDARMWVHTGTQCRPWCGHETAEDFVVMGNFLAGRHVVDSMASTCRETASEPLAERLLRTLEAGRDAGGQADANGRHARERSAAIRVVGSTDASLVHDAAVAPIDLRIDLHADAVTALRELYVVCAKVPTYNALRSSRPGSTPALGVWEAENMGAPRPPSVLDGDS